MHMSYIHTYAKANSTKKWGKGEDFENGSSKWTDPNCGKIVHCVASRGCWGRLAGWSHKILYNTLASYGIVDVPVVTWAFPFHELFPLKSRWWCFFTMLIAAAAGQKCTAALWARILNFVIEHISHIFWLPMIYLFLLFIFSSSLTCPVVVIMSHLLRDFSFIAQSMAGLVYGTERLFNLVFHIFWLLPFVTFFI